MSKQVIYTSNAPAPIGPYSQAIKAGDFIFLSGMICLEPSSGTLINDTLNNEVQQIMKNISAVLTEAKADFSKVVKTSIFLKNMNDFAEVNAIYGTYFSENPPARETVEVSRLPKDVRVEISVTLYLG
jgi:2-iminobutanoate/2-iminopropanoate deaminase